MSLFDELKRRNVFKVTAAYVVTAWLVAQVADLAADAFGAPDWVMRMLIVVLALGLPVAIFFAWAFELTPEGIKREEDVDRSESITPQTGQRLNQGIIVALSLAVAVLLVDRFWLSGRAVDGGAGREMEKSIAVLPFDDFSPGGDQGWFADGLAEEILNALARAPDLKVASRTASFRFKDSDEPLDAIARQLGVAHVLEGSIRRAGDDIRVTAQLIRADDGSHLWSENFDGSAKDAIRIQEEISAAIARALKTAMDPAALKAMVDTGTTSVAAYEAMLRGLALAGEASDRASQGPMRKALDAFKSATRIDPSFARAHYRLAEAWLADRQASTFLGGYTGLAHETAMAHFEQAISQALAHAEGEDKLLYESIASLAELRLKGALSLLKAYAEARPNDTEIREDLLELALWTADHELARRVLRVMEDSRELDQLAGGVLQGYYRIGDTAANARVAREVLELRPNAPAVLYQVHRALLWDGAVEEAALLVPRIVAGMPPRAHMITQIRQACAESRRADAERLLRQYQTEAEDDPTWRWHVSILLNPPGEAAGELQSIYDSGNLFGLAAFLNYPQFDPSPFPELMAVLTREGISRPEPIRPPFACESEIPVQKSVAVLPFANLSANAENEYFADGVAEEVLNLLAKSRDLRVISRSSAFSFKGQSISIPEVAERLGATHVLEGSIRRAGNQVRITAQLIDAGTDAHLWSETFDRELTDVFAIQEEIAGAIAEALQVKLGAFGERRMAIDIYELILEARNALSRRSDEAGLRRGVALLRDATVRVPDNAEAWGQLALAQMVLANWYDRDGESLARVADQARRALDLDPDNVSALTALGAAELFSFEFEAAEEHLRRAVELNANSVDAANWYGDFLFIVGRHAEALVYEQQSALLDPLVAVHQLNIGFVQHAIGDVGAALDAYERAVQLDPGFDAAQRRFLRLALIRRKLERLREFVNRYGSSMELRAEDVLAWADWLETGEPQRILDQARALTEDPEAMIVPLRVVYQDHKPEIWDLTARQLEETAGKGYPFYLWPMEYPTDPWILEQSEAYEGFWRTPPRDKLLRLRGHWVTQ